MLCDIPKNSGLWTLEGSAQELGVELTVWQGPSQPIPPSPVHFWWQAVIVLLATRDKGSATTGEGMGRGRGTLLPPSCPDSFWSRADHSSLAPRQPSGYMTRVKGQFGM